MNVDHERLGKLEELQCVWHGVHRTSGCVVDRHGKRVWIGRLVFALQLSYGQKQMRKAEYHGLSSGEKKSVRFTVAHNFHRSWYCASSRIQLCRSDARNEDHPTACSAYLAVRCYWRIRSDNFAGVERHIWLHGILRHFLLLAAVTILAWVCLLIMCPLNKTIVKSSQRSS